MEYIINNKVHKVIINKKRIKNIYIRVDNDLNIVVNTPHLTSHKDVFTLIEKEIESISKMVNRINKKELDGTYFLGRKIDVIVLNNVKHPVLEDDILFIPKYEYDYYKYLSKDLFLERLNIMHNKFEEKIPFPKLKIRKMKSKWGVCNKRDNSITLNLELIKKEMIYIDYVIIHELSHFVHMNHSSSFWEVVEKYMPEYKRIRKELRE